MCFQKIVKKEELSCISEVEHVPVGVLPVILENFFKNVVSSANLEKDPS